MHTIRERYLKTLLFGRPDRVPLEPGYGRKSTRAAWHAQGLPPEVDDGWAIAEYAYRLNGGTLEWPAGGEGFEVNSRMIPQFEEKVLWRGESTQIVQDWKGNVCEISTEFTTEYLRNAIDFVTRRWVKCPVESRADWEDMKRRYDPDDPARYPSDAATRAARLKERTHFVSLSVNGPFWQLREWCGFEHLCLLMIEQPDFVQEMAEFWTEFVSQTLAPILARIAPDQVQVNEDMAYKLHSMISPKMIRRFVMPAWKQWVAALKAGGCAAVMVDSDGYIGELLPLWIESGFDITWPVEVAAGNDIVAFRNKYGHQIAFGGGIDKRALARGGGEMRAELDRVAPVIRDGGYIPGCDHGVPPDISWPNFVEYTRRLAQLTGWL